MFAHPKENTANTANNIKMLTHFLITVHLLSSSLKRLQGKRSYRENGYQKSLSMSSKKYKFLSSLWIFCHLLLLRFCLLRCLLGFRALHPTRFRTACHGFTTSVPFDQVLIYLSLLN